MTWYPPSQPPGSGQDSFYEYPPLAYQPAPVYAPPGGGGSGAGPQARPLPLRAAIKQLPRQYWRILTRPGAATFAAEMGKAEWGIVWAQVIGQAVLGAIFSALFCIIFYALFGVIQPAGLNGNGYSLFPPLWLLLILVSIYSLIGFPAGFFFGQGITYLLAKAFGGQGTFLTQAYTFLLFQTPIALVSYVLLLIPIVGSIGSLAGIYAYVLEVFALMATHRLSGGKATAVVLIPVAVGILLVVGFYVLFLVFIFSITKSLPSSQITPPIS